MCRFRLSPHSEKGAGTSVQPWRVAALGRFRLAPALLADSEVISMRLPFTREQFFDVFAAYNTTLWPGVLVLWIASTLIVALVASSRRPSDRVVSTLLAVHWGWSALAYHVAFFTPINPAAWLFAGLFLVQAVVFFWWGAMQGDLRFNRKGSSWAPVAWVFIGYALLYPAINAAQHLTVTRIPTFGVPCPTTVFTAGLLMLATPRSWRLSVIPIIWSAIGGSAAFLLGVRADYALPIAGSALAVFSFRKTTRVETVICA